MSTNEAAIYEQLTGFTDHDIEIIARAVGVDEDMVYRMVDCIRFVKGQGWSHERSAGAAPLDVQADDLLEACYERNIHSRGDMEYAFQPWALDVERLAEAMWGHQPADLPDTDTGSHCGRECATAIAAEYARLSKGRTE